MTWWIDVKMLDDWPLRLAALCMHLGGVCGIKLTP